MTTAAIEMPQAPPAWGAVGSMTLCVTLLIASEFMPVSLLTPMADGLGTTEGMAGQAISVSGLFAVVTSLLIPALSSRFDRRHVLAVLSASMLASLVLVAMAPNVPFLMAARALLGITVGGFWSLSTATVMRLVPPRSVPRALGAMYMGNAVATAFAAPVGSYLGGVIGWRGVFWLLVPLAVATVAWQWFSMPSMPAQNAVPPGRMLALVKQPHVARAMAGVMLTFGGAFTAFTYFRPFLEQHAGASLPQLSLLLLVLGAAGFVGTYAGGVLQQQGHLYRLLRGLPLGLAAATGALLFTGSLLWPVALALVAWGTLNAAVPVAWFNWLAQAVPDEAEGAGGLMVAGIQLAIMVGAGFGGLLLDRLSIDATMLGAVALLVLAGLAIGNADRLRPRVPD
jgi:predicted MFS family arabinose efflux permease